MDIVKRIIGILILLGVVWAGINSFFEKTDKDKQITYSTSDAKDLKGEFSIALDSWIGYFPFKSPVFGKLMRDAGYRIKIVDDKADYEERMKMLKKGNIDFAVSTVDSYLNSGASVKFPGIIVAVIDESKGGDAIVARKDKVKNIDVLKVKRDFKIAFTPLSPSEYLLKAISVHFGIPRLKRKDDTWRVEVNGAEEAYQKIIDGEVDLASLWEPYVSKAISKPGIIKIIGSEDIEKLIVDVLLVNRKYAIKNPELVKLFVKNYFETLRIYKKSKRLFLKDILSIVKSTNKEVEFMLRGVKWATYSENIRWFGLDRNNSYREPMIIGIINSTINILLDINDLTSNPLPDEDPYTILNSNFIKDLYKNKNLSHVNNTSSLNTKFSKLSEGEWDKLHVVGSLKLRPISFRSGTSGLDENGISQIKLIADSIKHYPNFRIKIIGHTGLRGDPTANEKLSFSRADAVMKKLIFTYNIDRNRVNVKGVGAKSPLIRLSDESSRAYNNRLKRVEILFLTKD